MTADGHNTYLPDPPDANWEPGEWILCDTYPTPRAGARLQTVYLYHRPDRPADEPRLVPQPAGL